jgi:IS5 family transposase
MLANHREFLAKISDHDLAIYKRVLPDRSPLLDALDMIPWDDFRPDLEKFYCRDLGQPASSVILLLKMEYLQYLYHLSDRAVVIRANTDLLFRWFLQVPIMYRLPDSSTLCRFRARIGQDGLQDIFDRLIRIARGKGLVKDRLRLKDATHVYANIAVPTTLKLLAQLRQKMLAVIEPIDPEIAQGFRIQAERISTEMEKGSDDDRLQARLDLVGDMLAWMLLQPDRSDEDDRQKFWKRFNDVRTLAQKILSDCLNPGQGDRTLSVVDSDARRGMHGEYYDGYMVDMMMDADSQLITQVEVLPANGAEAQDAVNLIKSEQQAHGNTIDQLSIDGAGFNGPMLRALEEMNVDVITPPRDFGNADGFASTEFELTPDGQHVTCPAGETSNKGYQDAAKPNRTTFDFPPTKCWGCPLRPQCNPNMKETSRRGRRVNKNEYEGEYERARQKSKTKQYEQVRREHPAIERKLGEVARHGRGRHARYWGRSKVKIQQLLTCFTVNIKRMLKLLAGGYCAQTAAIA